MRSKQKHSYESNAHFSWFCYDCRYFQLSELISKSFIITSNLWILSLFYHSTLFHWCMKRLCDIINHTPARVFCHLASKLLHHMCASCFEGKIYVYSVRTKFVLVIDQMFLLIWRKESIICFQEEKKWISSGWGSQLCLRSFCSVMFFTEFVPDTLQVYHSSLAVPILLSAAEETDSA